ncbi:MAG: hypothetical protein N4A49_06240 [Marinifilaceae bacterium]|jgi:beta-lactamase superfamily II metal-dependent hydrolase|nr:hypothetical protein [Marinifilaceae bacterium]
MNDTKIHFFSIGNGDAILIQNEFNSKHTNILIDGGKERNKLRYNKMRNEVLKLIENGAKGNLDLVIVSHSDDDHIGGILNMAEDDKIKPLIKKYIFHSEKNISDYLEEDYLNKEKYPVNASSKGTVKSSFRQDLELTQILQKSGKWDERINLAGEKINYNNFKLTVLSPTVEKLELLQAHWKIKKDEYYKESGMVKSSDRSKCTFDYDIEFKDFDFDTIEVTEDNSPVNGASIAFVYEDNVTKGLFLSDAHPTVIIQSLKTFVQEGNDRIKFDFVKLSHHGSKKNLTQELLDLIDCENFIITANANKTHCHPSKQTLAMIIQHYGENNVKFFFSEENPQLKKIFSNENFSNLKYPIGNKLTIIADK